jgi:hypothetical protein
MRYILNDSGFIQAVSFNNPMICNNKTCTEYTGEIPTGYETLAIWSETANINAYKIVNGNLTYDSEEDARLQSLWDSQKTSGVNDVEVLNAKSDSTTDTYSCNYLNNAISDVTSSNLKGNAQIGKFGIEWGQVNITSAETGTSAQGTTLYVGSKDITFKYEYKNTPQVITSWKAGYYNQVSTYSGSTTTTSASVSGYLTSAGSTRTIGYIVIGEIAE